jgi:thiamine-monophosphate kinase
MNEFELITHYFESQTVQRNDVVLGIGDDAAVLQCPEKQQLVSTMDTMVEGVHFDANISAHAIGYKLAIVNLSDIAAMGAVPAWASLSLSMPVYDKVWLKDFSQGFLQALAAHHVQLIGGDTIRGALSFTCQLTGFVPIGQALTRAGAQVNDVIVVSGYLGDAGRALALQQQVGNVSAEWQQGLEYPTARIALGQALRGIATAAIDISDGLLADCQHILERSGMGACIQVDKLPLSEKMRMTVDRKQAQHFALTAGDDYELCFCVPQAALPRLASLSDQLNILLTPIGQITQEKALVVLDENNQSILLNTQGYRHF